MIEVSEKIKTGFVDIEGNNIYDLAIVEFYSDPLGIGYHTRIVDIVRYENQQCWFYNPETKMKVSAELYASRCRVVGNIDDDLIEKYHNSKD